MPAKTPRAKKATANKFDALSMASARPVPTKPADAIQLIARDRIKPGRSQYRLHFGDQQVKALATIFEEKGFHGLLWVEPDPDKDGEFLLISGETSWRAAEVAGLNELRCEVFENLTERERAELGYVANDAATALNLIEDTLAIIDLISLNLGLAVEDVTSVLYRINNHLSRGKSHDVTTQQYRTQLEEMFDRLGISKRIQWQSFIRNRLPLLRLPEDILKPVQMGQLDGCAALLINRIEERGDREQVIQAAIEGGLSVREIRKLVTNAVPKTETPEPIMRFNKLRTRITPEILEDGTKMKHVNRILSQLEKLLAVPESE